MDIKNLFIKAFNNSFLREKRLVYDVDPRSNDIPGLDNSIDPGREHSKELKKEEKLKNEYGKKLDKVLVDSDVQKTLEISRLEQAALKEELSKEEFDQVFISESEFKDQETALGKWVISTQREKNKINGHSWKPYESIGALDAMRDDWKLMGLPVESGFYNKVFGHLAKSTNDEFLNGLDFTTRKNYENPRSEESQKWLQANDKGFYKAWQFYEAVRNLATAQDVDQEKLDDKIENADKSTIAEKTEEAVIRNLDKFKKAIRERDYATAGIYVVGIYALYKSYKSLSPDKQGKVGKILMFGAAAYAANHFAETAGYDVLEKLGLRNPEHDVEGTFMAELAFLDIKEAEKIDYSIFLKTSNLPLEDLYREYKVANKNGIHQIDPEKFSGFEPFKEFRRGKDSEYKEHVAKQLYLITHVLSLGYEKHIGSKKPSNNPGEELFGKSFEEALDEPRLKGTKVRNLMAELAEYSTPPAEVGYFEPEMMKRTRERFEEVFPTSEGYAFDVDKQIDEARKSMRARLKGFPIVIVPDTKNNDYVIFSSKDYYDAGGSVAWSSSIGRIPIEGDLSDTDKNDILDNVDSKMQEMLTPISNAGGKIITKPEFNGTNWVAKVEIPGASQRGIQGGTGEAIISIDEKGLLMIDIPSMDLSVNINYFIDQNYPYVGPLFTKMANYRDIDGGGKDDLRVLAPFFNVGLVDYVKPGAGSETNDDGTGKYIDIIRVAGKTIEVTHIREKKDPKDQNSEIIDKFIISEEDQAKLLQDHSFRTEYVKLYTSQSNEFRQTFDELEALLDQVPEEFHWYIFSGLKGWFTGATSDRPFEGVSTDFLTGTMPENYAQATLDMAEQRMKYAMLGAMSNSTKFSDVDDFEAKYWSDGLSRMRSTFDSISDEVINYDLKGDAIERQVAMERIINAIQHAGSNSMAYTDHLVDFEAKVFARFGKGTDVVGSNFNLTNQMISNYLYYTAYLDDPDINLDKNMTAEEKSQATSEELEPFFRLQYMAYVKKKILINGKKFGDNLPQVGSQRWDIMTYQQWKDSDLKTFAALDKIDELPSIDHNSHEFDVNDYLAAPDSYEQHIEKSDLDKYIENQYNNAVDRIKSDYGSAFNSEEMRKYLYGKFKKDKITGIFSGSTVKVKDSDGKLIVAPSGANVMTDKDGNVLRVTSQLFEFSDRINSIAGDNRKKQVYEVQNLVDDFVHYIFTAKKDGKSRFFRSDIGGPSEWIKKNYPDLATTWPISKMVF